MTTNPTDSRPTTLFAQLHRLEETLERLGARDEVEAVRREMVDRWMLAAAAPSAPADEDSARQVAGKIIERFLTTVAVAADLASVVTVSAGGGTRQIEAIDTETLERLVRGKRLAVGIVRDVHRGLALELTCVCAESGRLADLTNQWALGGRRNLVGLRRASTPAPALGAALAA